MQAESWLCPSVCSDSVKFCSSWAFLPDKPVQALWKKNVEPWWPVHFRMAVTLPLLPVILSPECSQDCLEMWQTGCGLRSLIVFSLQLFDFNDQNGKLKSTIPSGNVIYDIHPSVHYPVREGRGCRSVSQHHRAKLGYKLDKISYLFHERYYHITGYFIRCILLVPGWTLYWLQPWLFMS